MRTYPSIPLPEGFVHLNEINPDIRIDLRYSWKDNFLGRKVAGYDANGIIILTRQAADALQCAQDLFSKDGFDIVVYDAYRPQIAVDDFASWANDSTDQAAKDIFYPRIDKSMLFDAGYLASKSSHSRGSTVDISIISKTKTLHPPTQSVRELPDGFKVVYMNDGTLDMGSSFDLFDRASHYPTELILKEHSVNRTYMQEVMHSCGFESYHAEWWHFTLGKEPFPNTYFNFPVA